MSILIQNPPLHHPFTLIKGLIGYSQEDFSLTHLQVTKYCINELTEFMDAYTANYLTHFTSETLKKFSAKQT